MTTHTRLVASMATLLLLASPTLAASAGEDTTVPAVCGTKVPTITDKEMLVERTLYFHGTNRLGDVQGGGNAAPQGPFLMDETAPTGTETKYKSSKPGVFGNDTFGRNAVNGYWLRELDEGQRVVCAGSTFYAAAGADTIGIILFFDKPYANTTIPAISRVDATAAAGSGIKAYTGRFSFPGERRAETDISIQFAPAAPGALLAYDSTEAVSSFTYVTIEPKPEV